MAPTSSLKGTHCVDYTTARCSVLFVAIGLAVAGFIWACIYNRLKENKRRYPEGEAAAAAKRERAEQASDRRWYKWRPRHPKSEISGPGTYADIDDHADKSRLKPGDGNGNGNGDGDHSNSSLPGKLEPAHQEKSASKDVEVKSMPDV
jgi:hypothetical protein